MIAALIFLVTGFLLALAECRGLNMTWRNAGWFDWFMATIMFLIITVAWPIWYFAKGLLSA